MPHAKSKSGIKIGTKERKKKGEIEGGNILFSEAGSGGSFRTRSNVYRHLRERGAQGEKNGKACKFLQTFSTTTVVDELLVALLPPDMQTSGPEYDWIIGAVDKVMEKMISEGAPAEEVHKAFRESKLGEMVRKKYDLPPYIVMDEKHLELNKKQPDSKNDGIENCESECLEDGSEPDIKGTEDKKFEKYLSACKSCRMSSCSNCLVPFKNGDKLVKAITSNFPSHCKTNIPIEVALMCVFGVFNPFPRWIKEMERNSKQVRVTPTIDTEETENNICCENSKVNTDDETMMENGKQEKVESVDNPIKEKPKPDCPTFNLEESELSEPPGQNLELVQKKQKEIEDCPKNAAAPDFETSWSDELDKCSVEKQELIFEQLFKNLIEAINTKSVVAELPDFQLCLGCGELLTLLFTAWENLFCKKLTEEAYYYAVILAFKHSKMAQEVVLRSPISSAMNILNKYAREFHPIGCQQRSSRRGTKFTVGESQKRDLIKGAVGNLHAYLTESYRRVRADVIPFLRLHETLEKVCLGYNDKEDTAELEATTKDVDVSGQKEL